ncbi:MAG: DoxX family protein [Candidatus Auribacterota bacterium]|jgi:putative oxidoreductase|nr:DoxX family protein [Candidatus Auribacterota bacterium]
MGASTAKKILFATSPEKNAGYLLLRIFVGYGFITHGYGKVFKTFSQFAEYIGSLNVPAPTIAAALAAGAEFFGGILLILGLCTRITSFFLTATMVVAAFIAHAGAPFAQRELAFLYLFCSALFLLKGAGSLSIDNILGKK